MSSSPPELPPNGYLLDELDLISEPMAAIAIDTTTQTLIKYRKDGKGPPYVMVGRKYFYSRARLKEWLAAGGTRPARDIVSAMTRAVSKPPPVPDVPVPQPVKPARRRPQQRAGKAPATLR